MCVSVCVSEGRGPTNYFPDHCIPQMDHVQVFEGQKLLKLSFVSFISFFSAQVLLLLYGIPLFKYFSQLGSGINPDGFKRKIIAPC